MRSDDFFEAAIENQFGFDHEVRRFRREFVRSLRQATPADLADAEVATALSRVVHDELEAYGTSGDHTLDDHDMQEALLAIRALDTRLGLEPLKLPFRDFKTFRTHWMNNGARGSWQARRDLLESLFAEQHDRLADLETATLTSSLANPVSPRGRTGWARVDEEINELRRHFLAARTPQDYRTVGNDVTIVTETLGRAVYDPKVHVRKGEAELPVGKTKLRLERFIEDAMPGADSAEMRKLARAVIDAAQAVKHSTTPTRRQAGIAADATIMLANLLRRIAEPENGTNPSGQSRTH